MTIPFLSLIEFWNSKGNTKTKSRLKDKWYKDFKEILNGIINSIESLRLGKGHNSPTDVVKYMLKKRYYAIQSTI